MRTYGPDFSIEDPVASATLTTRDLLTHKSGLTLLRHGRRRTAVFYNGAIDGFTVHLGFLRETGQGLIVLMNRDSEAQMAIAYSAYDRLLGLEPLDWPTRLARKPTPLQAARDRALDFPMSEVVGTYAHPAYAVLTVCANGDKLAMQFRRLRFTLLYQGERRFLTL